MAANFGVTPTQLMTTSKALNTISADFSNEVKQMYNSLEDLITKWQGEGSSEYYKIISERRKDIESIGFVINQYSTFLAKAAFEYDRTDNDIASAASKF